MSKKTEEITHPLQDIWTIKNILDQVEELVTGIKLIIAQSHFGIYRQLKHFQILQQFQDRCSICQSYFRGQLKKWEIIHQGRLVPHRLEQFGPAFVNYYPNGRIRQKVYYHFGQINRSNGPAILFYNKKGRLIERFYYRKGQEVDKFGNKIAQRKHIINYQDLAFFLDS